jgi:outer membrane protein insertion porin family
VTDRPAAPPADPPSLRRPHALRAPRLGATLALALGMLVGRAQARQEAPEAGAPQPQSRQPETQPASPPIPTSAPALEPYEGRLIREVRIEGLSKVPRQLVENQVRSKPGTPLSRATVEQDIQRLTRLGRFRKIDARVVSFDDKSVALVYEFTETPLINDVQATGNRQISDQELAAETSLLKGTAVDPFQIDRAKRRIVELYRKKGFYQAEVTIDEPELEKTGNVVFKIREGERVKVTDLRFEAFDGRLSFTPGQLRQSIKTKVASVFETGPLDDDTLDQDVGGLVAYYQDRGYLDVRVGRRVTDAPNRREAIVTFIIAEGPVYTLRSVRVEQDNGVGESSGRPPVVFTAEQIAGLMKIKAGDVYSVDRIRKSVTAVQEAYGKLGYVDAKVARTELRDLSAPQVDLMLLVVEGRPFRTGINLVQGDELTRGSVIRKQIELHPDRPLDTTSIKETRERLEATRLFEPGSVKITIQPEDESRPGYRDVLVEVKETNTGSVSFGAGINSDLGVVGTISLDQKNFDIADTPDSIGEFFAGRAFRGGGQSFNITAAPGTVSQRYSISLSDPYVFGTDYSAGGAAFYQTRKFNEYSEDRFGGQVSVGRKFGERWSGAITVRAADIDLHNIDAGAPVDVFAVQAPHILTGLGGKLTRVTADSRLRPTNGTKLDLAVEQVGALGGDYNFTHLGFEHTVYLPIYESFLGQRTVLSLNTKIHYIPQSENDVPVYERFYLGGRSFRGFDYRTVSPKGIRNDTMTLGTEPVGGTWSFFFGAEVEQPLWQDMVSGVVFVDSGTVADTPGFGEYRVSVGFGLRLYIRQLGPVPLAFDFGFPLLKQDGDKERLFSFSLDLPFR